MAVYNNPTSSTQTQPFSAGEIIVNSSVQDIQTVLKEWVYDLFKTDQQIEQAITLLRRDRLFNESNLTQMLSHTVTDYLKTHSTENNPLMAIFSLILQGDQSQIVLREKMAEDYLVKYPQDKQFEKNYVYLKTPHVLLTHVLILSGLYQCKNPENRSFYDEQIAGNFHGTVAFDKGDIISTEELLKIQEKEGSNAPFPISNALEKIDSHPSSLSPPTYLVKKWCSTPAMVPTQGRLSSVFIEGRLEAQKRAIDRYLQDLSSTSAVLQKTLQLPTDKKSVVAVIGPYGAGKTSFSKSLFQNEQYMPFSLDDLIPYLNEDQKGRKQDFHFEAMMLKNDLTERVSNIPCLLTEVAAIDAFRFNRLLKDFKGRVIFIREIAPEQVEEARVRATLRDHSQDDRIKQDAAKSSADDAKRFRLNRIRTIQDLRDPSIHYRLYCNLMQVAGGPNFVEVATVSNNELKINEGQEQLFKELTPEHL